MLATALPAQFTPTDIVRQDVNDIRLLAETLFQLGQLLIDLLVLFRPGLGVFLLLRLKIAIEDRGRMRRCQRQATGKKNKQIQKMEGARYRLAA